MFQGDTARGITSLRDHIVGRASRHGLTPLAGALFRGDARLAEAVITKCAPESLTRDEVRFVQKRLWVGDKVGGDDDMFDSSGGHIYASLTYFIRLNSGAWSWRRLPPILHFISTTIMPRDGQP